jgi:hypothetical protein
MNLIEFSEEIQIMVNSVIELIEKRDYQKARDKLVRISDKCDLEQGEKEVFRGFCQNDTVWVLLPAYGSIAGIYGYYDYERDKHVCTLVAGPEKFNQIVFVDISRIKKRFFKMS